MSVNRGTTSGEGLKRHGSELIVPNKMDLRNRRLEDESVFCKYSCIGLFLPAFDINSYSSGKLSDLLDSEALHLLVNKARASSTLLGLAACAA
jgi:hypothetical protein